MKWELHPKSEKITTSVPLSVEISEWKGRPSVVIDGIGELELKGKGGKLRTDFHLTLPGSYRLTVKDASRSEIRDLEIIEHRYLDFTNEFGFFLILFLIVMGGIVLWTRKIMKN